MTPRMAPLLLLALGACARAPEPAAPAPSPASAPAPATTAIEAPSAAPAPTVAPAPTAEPAREAPPLPAVELGQVDPAAAPAKMPSVTIVAPTRGQVLSAATAPGFAVKLRVSDWAPTSGQHLCVRVDRHPCRRVEPGATITLRELDPGIDEGQHALTVFARRGSGESVKPAGRKAAFSQVWFFVGKRTAKTSKEGGPMLFLDVPADGPAPPEGILLDPYVANADFGSGSFRLHASVGGPGLGAGRGESVDSLRPFRLRNPRPGEYVVRFSLFRFEPTGMKSASATEVSYESRPVQGPFAEVTRSFRVTAAPLSAPAALAPK